MNNSIGSLSYSGSNRALYLRNDDDEIEELDWDQLFSEINNVRNIAGTILNPTEGNDGFSHYCDIEEFSAQGKLEEVHCRIEECSSQEELEDLLVTKRVTERLRSFSGEVEQRSSSVTFSSDVDVCLIATKQEFRSLAPVLWRRKEDVEESTIQFLTEIQQHAEFAARIQQVGCSGYSAQDFEKLTEIMKPGASFPFGYSEYSELGLSELSDVVKIGIAYREWKSLLQETYDTGVRILVDEINEKISTFSKDRLQQTEKQLTELKTQSYMIDKIKILNLPLFLEAPTDAIKESINRSTSFFPLWESPPKDAKYVALARKILAKGEEICKSRSAIDEAYVKLTDLVTPIYKRGVDHFLMHGTEKEKELTHALLNLHPAKHAFGSPAEAVRKALYTSPSFKKEE
ncbi:MAG: hypothetical protein KGI80_01220 [Verrucomicrobiota bacterium]|nr:hypothetical protein [Verrucomicrobiota bacterium]